MAAVRLSPGPVSEAFDEKELAKAGYDENPLDNPELTERFQLSTVPMTTLTLTALEDIELGLKEKRRCNNFFALGLLYRLFDRATTAFTDLRLRIQKGEKNGKNYTWLSRNI